MLRAIAFYRAEIKILAILHLAGPSTIQQLAVYCRTYVPGLSYDMLERLVDRMHRARVLTLMRVTMNAQYWAIPGQALRKEDRRKQHKPMLADRRAGERRSGKGSWWATAPRQGWQGTVRERWDS